jgi:hypothetical protein
VSPDQRRVEELIGVYNADGGIIGELRYVAAKITGRGHCALCDITHRGIARRPEWTEACSRLPIPFELMHRNERSEDVMRACADGVPCVLARVDGDLVTLLGPTELEECAAGVDRFDDRLRAAAAAHGLALDPSPPP